MSDPEPEPGSFRDRTARVFYQDGIVFRGLSASALRHWDALTATGFYARYAADGAIVATERVDAATAPRTPGDERWAAILKHETIPFVSYPYEWSFGMLKDAAVLQLDLLLAALDEGMTVKDASPFNIQWRGPSPVFLDLASFQTLAPGEPWVGYQQFCRLFLYPLLLVAYRDVPFQPWLRGWLDGIDADTCRKLLAPRDFFRPGVIAHVYLQARAQSAYKATTRDIRQDLRSAGFNRGLIKANVSRLRKLVAGLAWKRERSVWSAYTDSTHYGPQDAATKRDFVRDVARSREWGLVWDLGANTGTFSVIAAERAKYVVALDADHLAVERLYQQLKGDGRRNVLPLVGNLADPSPDLGWRNRERKQLAARGRPELVLCLALIHHLVIGANIPLTELLEWLEDLGADVVIEFVTRQDPMVQGLLRNKEEQYDDYDLPVFERELNSRFVLARRQPLGSGSRILYHARPANGS